MAISLNTIVRVTLRNTLTLRSLEVLNLCNAMRASHTQVLSEDCTFNGAHLWESSCGPYTVR